MQLIRRLRNDESGAALVTALLCTMVMLALGLALLAIVDTQANGSTDEATRDRGFNLAESVLTSEAFVLGRNWPTTGIGNCFQAGAGFGDTIGATATAGVSAQTLRLRDNLNVSYDDDAYDGATWQVNLCDDTSPSTVWNDVLQNNHNYDANANGKLWVRTQATVRGKTRALVGLVKVRQSTAMNQKWGLVSGSVAEDLGPATSAITGNNVVTTLTGSLLTTNPPVAADPDVPSPGSGVTGLRCGLLDNITQVKTCVTGAIGALSMVPAVNTLVTNGRFEQFPTQTSTSPVTIGQMRKEAIDDGTYVATPTPGADTYGAAPSCGISYASDATKVVFIEKVGTGDQYCYVDVTSSKRWKALVVGSGRIIIRGSNSITPYTSTTSNRLTAVVYALNLQSDHASAADPIDVVTIDKAARVVGAVHADGKNASVRIVNPDFNTNALINAVLCDNVLTCALAPTLIGLTGALGLSGTVDALINGRCLVTVLGICTSLLPAQGLNEVVGGITTQLTTYGSAINADTDVINALTVFSTSGVMPGTFRDLQPR